MRNSTTYMSIIDEGKEIGKEIGKEFGKEIGKEEMLRETIFRYGGKRLGDPTAVMIDRINLIHSLHTLQGIADKVIEVESWDEIQDHLNVVLK